MKFVPNPQGSITGAVLVYREKEYSFGAEPRPTGSDTSISINELELMVDGSDNRVLFVAGFCPWQSWRLATLTIPLHRRVSLIVESEHELPPGISIQLDASNECWTQLDLLGLLKVPSWIW